MIGVGDGTAVFVGGNDVGVGFGLKNPQANVARNKLSPAHVMDLKFFFITGLQ
jgi:hypothetical protein